MDKWDRWMDSCMDVFMDVQVDGWMCLGLYMFVYVHTCMCIYVLYEYLVHVSCTLGDTITLRVSNTKQPTTIRWYCCWTSVKLQKVYSSPVCYITNIDSLPFCYTTKLLFLPLFLNRKAIERYVLAKLFLTKTFVASNRLSLSSLVVSYSSLVFAWLLTVVGQCVRWSVGQCLQGNASCVVQFCSVTIQHDFDYLLPHYLNLYRTYPMDSTCWLPLILDWSDHGL